MMENILDERGELEIEGKNSEDYNLVNIAVENNNGNSLGVILKWIDKLKEDNPSIGKKYIKFS